MSQPRKRKSAADRRAEIVETAIRLSAAIGPDRVTTQQLADAVGVTQPAIFRHFATKSDIWLAVGEHIAATFREIHAQPHAVVCPDAHATLKSVVGRHFVHITDNPAIPAILFSRELHTEIPSLRETFAELMAERGAAIVGLIHTAQASGLHRAEIVAEDAAHLVLAAIQGMSMRWSLEDRAFDLTEEGSRMIDGLIDSFRA
jgi:AcrR family transcriptional regulator